MSSGAGSFLIVSLPSNVAPSNNEELPLYLEKNLIGGHGVVSKFAIPTFKIGTLDSLVQQSDELEKMDVTINGILNKIDDILNAIYDNNSGLVASSKRIDGDKNAVEYIEKFRWNDTKYRTDNKSIKELIDLISNEAIDLDSDLRNLYNSYNVAKSNLSAANRKQNGDLSVISLHDIVGPQDFVLNSEHLVTVLVVVPKSLQKLWLSSYETLTEYVVPRSSHQITEDSEYVLNNVTLFKKKVPEFLAKCRELKFLPREFNYSEELVESLKQEYSLASRKESQMRGELIRLTRTSFQDVLAAWVHIKSLRVFVESILRYGLPPNFQSYFVRTNSGSEGEKSIANAKSELVKEFGYLGGNAFNKDKKGNVMKDSSLHQYAGLVDQDYEPFVLYTFQVN
ncbi:H(+)-transporting V1 sector ATPase subunit C [Saccharomycopsis crataegensis]|uniref:V-type proton ATPase subunit C n=1 Tax=Saccharomycopsis crataegensis TaxID=43959 RepID=A0AAV5QG67_9ASCO|nr:H(+)-transporting V1 sector ATPase subunit C [Saccharomycopsis crataegensis]